MPNCSRTSASRLSSRTAAAPAASSPRRPARRPQPDGYTLCVIYHSTMSYNPLLFTNLPYDPDRDLVPVTRLFFLNEGLFVSSALGVNSVAELKTTGAGQSPTASITPRSAKARFPICS